MKRIKAIVFSLCAILAATFSLIGFSSWIVSGSRQTQYNKDANFEAQKIAYIKNGENKTYYTTLEKAISLANSMTSNTTIYVIPGTQYKIKNDTSVLKSITINKNVTLTLPFQDELIFDVWKTTNANYDYNGTQTATSTEALLKPDQYRTTQITIGKNVRIINMGTIQIGGVSGSAGGGNSPAGQTCYKFSEILFEGLDNVNYQLLNYGTIENKGRLIGVDRNVLGIENLNGSKTISNFVVRENKGGSALLGLGGGLLHALNLEFKVSPFNRVYMPNIMVKSKTNAGASIVGKANMYGNDSNNECEISIVSNDTKSLFCIKDSSFLLSEVYNDSLKDNEGKTVITNFEKMKLDFFGDFTMQYMTMEISAAGGIKASVKTNTVLFPLSYYHEVSFNCISNQLTTVKSSQNLKILPGGKLKINSNVSFNVGEMAIYETFNDNIGWSQHVYPKNIAKGQLLVGGTFIGGVVGGTITNISNNSSLQISNNKIVSKEVRGIPGKSVSDSDYDQIPLEANGLISYNGFAMKQQNIFENISYKGNVDSEKYWSATITPRILISDTNNGTSVTLNKGESTTIKIDQLIPDESLFDISTFTWIINKKGTRPSDQTYSKIDGSLNDFTFTVKKMPSWFITWTYDISISGKDINGNLISCNVYTITLKG